MEVQDIPAIVAAVRAKAPEAIIMIDNTWAAGILFDALAHGIDISIQAGTKYLIGHSDAMIGTAVANARCIDQLRENSYLMGQMVDADTAYMASRGCARWAPVCVSMKRARFRWQSGWQRVPKWRGLITRRWRRAKVISSGSVILTAAAACSLYPAGKLSAPQLAEYLDHFHHFSMAYSWGGYESLILANQPEELAAIRPAGGVDFTGTLVRLHIGLEHVDDLLADLDAGFARLTR